MQFTPKEQIVAHDAFLIGLVGKCANAILEIIGAVALFFLNEERIFKIVAALTHEELFEDQRDWLSNFLIHAAANFSVHAKFFAIFYLLSHGIIKLGLVIALLKRKLWAYPLALAVFGIFLLYQIYQLTYNRSVWVIALGIFDILFIIVTALEYKRVKLVGVAKNTNY